MKQVVATIIPTLEVQPMKTTVPSMHPSRAIWVGGRMIQYRAQNAGACSFQRAHLCLEKAREPGLHCRTRWFPGEVPAAARAWCPGLRGRLCHSICAGSIGGSCFRGLSAFWEVT